MQDNDYTGADVFVDALTEYGVTHVFGNPGTTELPILQAIGAADLEYVLGLHEDIAVGMAAGYAQTRRYQSHHESVLPVGVVNLHVAPGLAHGLGNVQNAAWTGAPLVVTAGAHSTDFQHEEPILSGDLAEMAKEYTKWSAEVQDVSALPTMLRRAFRVALSPPTGPVFLGLPMDVMMAPTTEQPEPLGAIPSGGRGDARQVAAAAEALEAASDPVLVLGDHVARAGDGAIDAAVNLAEATGAAVYSEMITCEVNFPPSHEQWVSFISPDIDMPKAVFDTDTLVFVGCSTNTPYIPYEEEYIPSTATCVQVHEDTWEIGKNHSVDVGIVGDPGAVMHDIAATVDVAPDERERRRAVISARREQAHEFVGIERDDSPDGGISKVALAEAMRSAAPDSLLVNESNTSKYALLTQWALEPEQFISNKNGGLGYGLPATVGAAVAMEQRALDERRPVVGFVGDGSYLYYPQSLFTAARYDLDLTVVVPNNRNYRILKDGMLGIYGGSDEDHEFVGMDFDPGVDIAANAETHGASGITVTDSTMLESALDDAIGADASVVVDVAVRD